MHHDRKTSLTRTATVAIAVLAAGAGLPAVAQDGLDADVRAGWYTDAEEAFVGGGVLWDLGASGGWYANPNVEWVPDAIGDLITINGDVHYDFPVSGNGSFWAGAGVAVIRRDDDVAEPFDDDDEETDVGLNLLAGFGATSGRLRPYVQGKVTIADDSEAVVAVGLRF